MVQNVFCSAAFLPHFIIIKFALKMSDFLPGKGERTLTGDNFFLNLFLFLSFYRKIINKSSIKATKYHFPAAIVPVCFVFFKFLKNERLLGLIIECNRHFQVVVSKYGHPRIVYN